MMNHLSFVMFLSPFPVRGATDAMPHRWGGSYISIHAPRAGNDSFLDRFSLMSEYFNPRSPCGERPIFAPTLNFLVQFQSTLPVRGATVEGHESFAIATDFNPRSPCGERPPCMPYFVTSQRISIHAPRAGSDGFSADPEPLEIISIHAPRAGSDHG